MELLRDQEIDSLDALEQRIHQAIDLVASMRRERDEALAEASGLREKIAGLTREVEALRAERIEVRSRITKLLGQIDSLAGA
jgi:FtsZ-binding cell division protein ZapB